MERDTTEQRPQGRAEDDERVAFAPGMRDALTGAGGALAVVLGATADGVTVQSADGRLVFANATAARVTGFATPRELLEAPVAEILQRFEIFDEAGAPLTFADLPGRQALAGEPAPERVVRFRVRATGEQRWALVRASPVRCPAGAVELAVNVFHDLTAVKRVEERLRFLVEAGGGLASSLDPASSLGEVARLAVSRIVDGCVIHVVGPDGQLGVAAAAHADAGKVALLRELGGDHDPSWPASPDAVLRAGHTVVVSDLQAALSAAPPRVADVLRALGARSYAAASIRAQDRVFGVLSLLGGDSNRLDEGDRALVEELARRIGLHVGNALLYADARRSVSTRDDLIAAVAHDLRNPLIAMLLNADRLRGHPALQADQRLVAQVETIARAGERMSVMLRDLLDISRIEVGALTVAASAVDVAVLVSEAVQIAEPLAVAKAMQLSTDVRVAAMLQCDRDRTLQVLSNLLGNAVKFGPRGGSISVTAERLGPDVRLTVRDDGPGIAPEALPHVFDRFWQARRADRSGIGIGLSIAKGIVEAHGGRIWVESEHGAGTAVHFTLRCA